MRNLFFVLFIAIIMTNLVCEVPCFCFCKTREKQPKKNTLKWQTTFLLFFLCLPFLKTIKYIQKSNNFTYKTILKQFIFGMFELNSGSCSIKIWWTNLAWIVEWVLDWMSECLSRTGLHLVFKERGVQGPWLLRRVPAEYWENKGQVHVVICSIHATLHKQLSN